MKGAQKYISRFLYILALFGLLFVTVPRMAAQADSDNNDADDNFNPPPCDFNNQFYADNGLDVTKLIGRFGDARQFGPPSRSSNQPNWVADEDNCFERDPVRRDIRILATTGGNADDGISPFTCANQQAVTGTPPPTNCTAQAGNPDSGQPETLEFISILAFVNNQNTFEQSYLRNVGFINGGLQGVQQNHGTDISIGQTLQVDGQTITEAPGNTLRGFSMQTIVGNFEAYGTISQFGQTLNCPPTATPPFTSQNCTPEPGVFAANPCSLGMIQHQQNPNATSIPQPCFQVADSTDSHGNPVSDVATPKLRQDWRFATNRNAIDGSDGNNPFATPAVSAPFGYFCDDVLGMWIITYFWFTQPPNTTVEPCATNFRNIGNANGFNLDGTPIILTAFELNTEIEGAGCGNEGQEDPGGIDGGAAWLVCPALPDPRSGAIAQDAFLDAVHTSSGSFQNTFLANNFTCLQQTGKFCFE